MFTKLTWIIDKAGEKTLRCFLKKKEKKMKMKE